MVNLIRFFFFDSLFSDLFNLFRRIPGAFYTPGRQPASSEPLHWYEDRAQLQKKCEEVGISAENLSERVGRHADAVFRPQR